MYFNLNIQIYSWILQDHHLKYNILKRTQNKHQNQKKVRNSEIKLTNSFDLFAYNLENTITVFLQEH